MDILEINMYLSYKMLCCWVLGRVLVSTSFTFTSGCCSSENYDTIGYGHNWDSLIILHELRAWDPTRSGCREKSIHLRHIYLICQNVCTQKAYCKTFKHQNVQELPHTCINKEESGEVWDQNSIQGGWKWSKVEGATPTSLWVLERPLTLIFKI